MSVKVYNKSHRTYLLEAEDGSSMKIPPLVFETIPDKYLGDITYRMAVKAGDFQRFETAKQGDQLEKVNREPTATAQGAKNGEKTAESKVANKPARATAQGAKTASAKGYTK